ncbi:KdpD-like non-kinase potassium sensor [Aureibacillus halotolerans]|uniref:Two-component system sensor histidine kinase KdpD n=1 Tax=Aureibacillus halotolerans TaxID=1508390 RepID=A0A4R6U7F1_9BACI|nr:KdpD-like non-kinase potassium sensor [Aureibacillus halotolerans]TDQ40495.1 two-component system sensor histidine kinase KdpD [Aureibacillus halotolerans]
MDSSFPFRKKTPDELLEEVKRDQKGKLTIYIGSAPGVGKTFRMLQEAHERKQAGVDVVIGLIETHGRAETKALIEGLEIVPLQNMVYKGRTFQELDIDAIIERAPGVVLIDELAHTNIPGSRNNKRYQDVLDVLDKGIDVISAVNIQHLESLHDHIQQITGVAVRERVPDFILQSASEILLIDVTPEILQQRLKAGKIYHSSKIQQSLMHFFTLNNLSALREIALREVADDVDERLEKSHVLTGSEAPTTSERILVCVQNNANAEMLIRRGWRIAKRLNAPLYVLHIIQNNSSANPHWQELCEQFNAIFIKEKKLDRTVPAAISDVTKRYRITQLILGQSARSRWEEIFKGSIVNTMMRHMTGVDIHIVADKRNE